VSGRPLSLQRHIVPLLAGLASAVVVGVGDDLAPTVVQVLLLRHTRSTDTPVGAEQRLDQYRALVLSHRGEGLLQFIEATDGHVVQIDQVGVESGRPQAATFHGEEPRISFGLFVEVAVLQCLQVDALALQPLRELPEREHTVHEAFDLWPLGLGLLRHARTDEDDLHFGAELVSYVPGVGDHRGDNGCDAVDEVGLIGFDVADRSGAGTADVAAVGVVIDNLGGLGRHMVGADGRLAHVGEPQLAESRG